MVVAAQSCWCTIFRLHTKCIKPIPTVVVLSIVLTFNTAEFSFFLVLQPISRVPHRHTTSHWSWSAAAYWFGCGGGWYVWKVERDADLWCDWLAFYNDYNSDNIGFFRTWFWWLGNDNLGTTFTSFIFFPVLVCILVPLFRSHILCINALSSINQGRKSRAVDVNRAEK